MAILVRIYSDETHLELLLGLASALGEELADVSVGGVTFGQVVLAVLLCCEFVRDCRGKTGLC